MAGADIIFDEDRGGPRHPSNYLSLPVDGLVHQSTKHIFPWSQAGAHEAPGTRVIIPSSYIEKIFKEATVKVTEELKNFTWLTRCLSINFLSPAVEVLIVEKLFTKPDGAVAVFRDIDSFYDAADLVIRPRRPSTKASDCRSIGPTTKPGTRAPTLAARWRKQTEEESKGPRTSSTMLSAPGLAAAKRTLTYWHCLDDELWTREG